MAVELASQLVGEGRCARGRKRQKKGGKAKETWREGRAL